MLSSSDTYSYLRKPEMRYSDQYLNNGKSKTSGNRRMGLSTYLLICAIGFGGLLITMNVYQLYHLSKNVFSNESPISYIHKKAVWIYAKKTSHLKHVVRIFTEAGYTITTSLNPPTRWDVMWAYDFPFTKEFKEFLTSLRFDQKVNHLPGTGHITLKVELATSKLRWIPEAFSIPKEKHQFLLMAERSPQKLWVQKSNNHRGIKIVNSKEVDLKASSTFIQEFVDNPLLIDKKKFDIGVYVVYTSVDPLQVYIYTEDILVRFCTHDYHPLKPEVVEKYVVGDEYISVDKMPSLQNYYNNGRMTFKNSLFTYLSDAGFDTNQIWSEISRCIGEMFISKGADMTKSSSSYHSKHNFFELVRVDFVLDDAGKVWLMEVNMSPNLSSDGHPINAVMYQQVVYNTLAMVGIASHIDERNNAETKEIVANDRNIMLPSTRCKSVECMNSCQPIHCSLCNQCLTDNMKLYLKKAFYEHRNKGDFARALPLPMKAYSAETINVNTEPSGESNQILSLWFKEKCKLDFTWCQ